MQTMSKYDSKILKILSVFAWDSALQVATVSAMGHNTLRQAKPSDHKNT